MLRVAGRAMMIVAKVYRFESLIDARGLSVVPSRLYTTSTRRHFCFVHYVIRSSNFNFLGRSHACGSDAGGTNRARSSRPAVALIILVPGDLRTNRANLDTACRNYQLRAWHDDDQVRVGDSFTIRHLGSHQSTGCELQSRLPLLPSRRHSPGNLRTSGSCRSLVLPPRYSSLRATYLPASTSSSLTTRHPFRTTRRLLSSGQGLSFWKCRPTLASSYGLYLSLRGRLQHWRSFHHVESHGLSSDT